MNYETLKLYIEKKLVSEQVHPEDENIRIFNYTPECQFSKAWDEVTMQCRGLIMNIQTGEILARPFPKFFNYDEHISYGLPVPNEDPIITEKLDGSLGIMYTFKGKTRIATRGSFASDQAIWATNWWKENKGDEPYGNDVTYLLEIIYPENRIVVNYDFSGLVHLASLYTDTGLPVPLTDGRSTLPVREVKYIPSTNIEELKKLDEPNSEGFVLYYPQANVRMKIKFPEYVRLHKIITGLSEIGIWEMLRDGADFAPLIEKVPDEFYNWLEKVKHELNERYSAIEEIAKEQFAKLSEWGNIDPGRSMWAERIKKMNDPAIGFRMLDKKDYKPMIWKMIRPHGRSQFKVDIDS